MCAVREDPEGNEIKALFDYAGSFEDKRVLEIGAGGGRLTWHYAEQAAYVVAIDPHANDIAAALNKMPEQLKDRLEFHAESLEQFEPEAGAPAFDVALLTWSL